MPHVLTNVGRLRLRSLPTWLTYAFLKPVAHMYAISKPRLVRFYKILRKSWRDSWRCWRNLQDFWKKSETLGGFSKCVIGYPSAWGCAEAVPTGHMSSPHHSRGYGWRSSSAICGRRPVPVCSIPWRCRWWQHPRLHRGFRRRDSSCQRLTSELAIL